MRTRNLEIPRCATAHLSSGPSDHPGMMALLRRQRVHLRIEIRFSLKADARQLRHGDVTVLDANTVGKAAIGLEKVGIALVAPEPEAGRDIERHLMSAMRNASAG